MTGELREGRGGRAVARLRCESRIRSADLDGLLDSRGGRGRGDLVKRSGPRVPKVAKDPGGLVKAPVADLAKTERVEPVEALRDVSVVEVEQADQLFQCRDDLLRVTLGAADDSMLVESQQAFP